MIKIKVSEATLSQLNWLVATCEGYTVEPNSRLFEYAADWALAGPIIKHENIQLSTMIKDEEWRAAMIYGTDCIQYGPDPLIAAMRCYVASKLGYEVEVPEELI